MKIKDITLDDIRCGKNWRVINIEKFTSESLKMEELEIEPLENYGPEDTLVYSGLSVYLKELGEPRSGFLNWLLGKLRRRKDCRFAPDTPKDLEDGMVPVVCPLVMVKEVQETGWDYCEYLGGRWQQLGLKPNRDAPLSQEYFADPVPEDEEFDVCGDRGPIRDEHRKGFTNWIEYLD